MNDTPRTDAVTFEQKWDRRRRTKDGACVDSDFARQLERELIAAQADVRRMDWLEHEGTVANIGTHKFKAWTIKRGEIGVTVRAAIDAAKGPTP